MNGSALTACLTLASAGILCLTQTVAVADTTWVCSTVQKEGDKPMAFRFEERGEDLFGLTYMQQLDNFFAPFQARKTDSNATRYKIVEDTDDRLVAIYAYPFDPYKDTAIDFVVIDKKSGVVHQGIVGMKPSEDIGFEGECQRGK